MNSQKGTWIFICIHTSFCRGYESQIQGKCSPWTTWNDFSCTWSIEPSFSNSNGHLLGRGKRAVVNRGPGCVSSSLPVAQCEASCLKLRIFAESGGQSGGDSEGGCAWLKAPDRRGASHAGAGSPGLVTNSWAKQQRHLQSLPELYPLWPRRLLQRRC